MKKIFLVVLATTLWGIGQLHADVWSFSHDNDFFFGSDDVYTGGAHIAWTGDGYGRDDKDFEDYYIEVLDALVESIPFTDTSGKQLYGSIALQELIMTPENKARRDPVYDDVPYAGMIGANFSLFAKGGDSLEEYRLSVGMFGPAAGAQTLQDAVHELIDVDKAQGWDNQLKNYFYAGIGYMRGMKHADYGFSNGNRFQWFNTLFADAGNAYIGAGGGTVVRYGHNMPEIINSPVHSSALPTMSMSVLIPLPKGGDGRSVPGCPPTPSGIFTCMKNPKI